MALAAAAEYPVQTKRGENGLAAQSSPASRQQAGFGGTRTALVLSNSVMPQERGARSGLMAEMSPFKRRLWKGSLTMEEQETGTDRTQPRCWPLPEESSRIGGQKLREKTTCICTLGMKCCFHDKPSLCCPYLGHCICVKVYRVHIGNVGLDDGASESTSVLLLQWFGIGRAEGNLNSKQFSG